MFEGRVLSGYNDIIIRELESVVNFFGPARFVKKPVSSRPAAVCIRSEWALRMNRRRLILMVLVVFEAGLLYLNAILSSGIRIFAF